jgi:hypothetical protein
VGTVASLEDAGLDPLGSYGGPTDSMRLKTTSQAREKGNAFGLIRDQRGAMRTWYPMGFTPDGTFDGTDIGAFEFVLPAAAGVKILGRVSDESGRAMVRVKVTVYDTETGATSVLMTNQFGRYELDDLEVGRLYVVTVRSRRTRSEQTQAVMIYDMLTEVDFVVRR